jgi:hypothetical protein
VVTRRAALVAGAALLAGCGAPPRPPADAGLLRRLSAARERAACCDADGLRQALAVAVEILPQLRSPAARRRVTAMIAEDAARLAELRAENGADPLVDAFGGILA